MWEEILYKALNTAFAFGVARHLELTQPKATDPVRDLLYIAAGMHFLSFITALRLRARLKLWRGRRRSEKARSELGGAR